MCVRRNIVPAFRMRMLSAGARASARDSKSHISPVGDSVYVN